MEYQNKMMTGEDMELKCTEEDCQLMFVFSAGEQEFFKEKGLKFIPTRCPDCRKKRKLAKLREGQY